MAESLLNRVRIVDGKGLAQDKAQAWDSFVKASASATFFHLSGWAKVLERSFGYRPHYIYAEDVNKICGVLPLFLIKALSGKAVVSLPFGVYGGVCADNDYLAVSLLEKAKELTREHKARYLELRHMTKPLNAMPVKELYATFIKELPKDKEACLQDLPRKARAAARRGIDSGLYVKFGIGLLKEFYDVYAISMRNLGSPIFPYAYVENLAREFKDNVFVMSVYFQNTAIASVFGFLYKNMVIPYYAGSLPQYFKYQPNNFMYLKLMEWGVENNYGYFDFGRSKKDTGSYHFKELQGFSAQPLYYQYYLNTIDEIPDVSPKSAKMQLAIKVWQKLPVWLTKLVGPTVSKLTPP